MSPKIVVTDFEFPDLAPERAVIEAAGFELVEAQCKTEAEAIAACADADAIINQYCQLTAGVIDKLERCKVISRYGIGLNTIDVPRATASGIYVANVPDGSLEEVSDHAIALMMGLKRGIGIYDRALRSGSWDYTAAKPLSRLRGQTLGFLSFGQIAQRMARKMAGFGLRMIAHDPYADDAVATEAGVELVDFDQLIAESDILSVHVPLTDETKHMVSDEQFAAMKSTALILNTARGPVIDEAALVRALKEGQIAGAGLDVFEVEPIGADHPLLSLPNVIVSPHCAWYSEGSEFEIRSKTAQNVVDVLQGREPTYLANPAVRDYLKR
ncbi:C-terminal binding protein [Vreelandella titanicae]|uniref:C-terminal binding protein n=1 Tax=Halomonadaceae TaxID=28256 RepID=UPI00059B527A|nr:C-terminal binding protein [Halomonas sp. KHS3]KIN17005.1 2-hydroxyacid dehydrogenase [Halomonas sp. KHS3]